MKDKTKRMKGILALCFLTLMNVFSFAQDSEKGLDKQINDWLEPGANWWEGFILSPITIAGHSIPIVLIILIVGASLFTIFFYFPAISRFLLAINTVRGKYDELDHHGSLHAENDEPGLEIDGDIIGTIKDESQEGEVSHFQALATAVSGTVGLGNIAGVAVAIAVGGPGATFWMIVCGLLGMSSKFVECTLGVKYRDIGEDGTVYGGPMYYLKKGFQEIKLSSLGKILAVVFAVFCIGASFGGGNAFQSNQAAAQMAELLGMEQKWIIGLILVVIVGIVIIGGIKRIAQVTEKIVPLMALIYVLAALFIILSHYDLIGKAISIIMEGAFNPVAGLGGIIGVIVTGFQRAAFSNEAGAGSAAIAHSAVKTKYPASEGVVALLEPFIDTVVICTMTALVIVIFNLNTGFFDYGNAANSKVLVNETQEWIGGVKLTSAAFAENISWFPIVLSIAVILFAISTMISWSYYGLQSWKFLFGRSKQADITYKVLFLIFIFLGSAATLDAVIKFSDAMILALVFPNMIGLLFLFPKVKQELNRYLRAIKSSKKN